MKSVKWFFLCGALAGLLTACEKHPASEVPGGHGGHSGHDAHAGETHADSHGAPAAAHTPAAHSTPVPEYFPKTN